MNRWIAFAAMLSTAGFAGGCLCLSVTLSALLGKPPADSTHVLSLLLPRMGTVMAPLLGAGSLLATYTAIVALRRAHPNAIPWVIGTLAFAGIALVTIRVHLPLNAELIADGPIVATRGAALVERWLSFHHLRTALALTALGALLWPMQRPQTASA